MRAQWTLATINTIVIKYAHECTPTHQIFSISYNRSAWVIKPAQNSMHTQNLPTCQHKSC